LEKPTLAVDVVLLSPRDTELCVLLQKRAEAPFPNALALPGVALKTNEFLKEAALRALKSKTGLSKNLLSGIYMEQLATFDALYRDPRGRTISVAYLALTNQNIPGNENTSWKKISGLEPKELPFDHYEIIQTAQQRLKGKLRYTNIASYLMPEEFKVDELRSLYESILGKELNRSNFRSKLVKIGLIEKAEEKGGMVTEKGGRPADLYQFTEKELKEMEDFI
ncbi:MAG: NUDIX hydrolase, partial [Leptospiraceae bacterium]|nr:NUDIX hydrolase [Leptospiraceae bacterium]